jgi:hypothetical protein
MRQIPNSELELQSTLLGIPVSALALISLAHKIFKIGLAPVFNAIVTIWRDVTAPLGDILKWLFSAIHISLPDWYVDLYILSFISGVVVWRRTFSFDKDTQKFRKDFIDVVFAWVYSAVSSLIIVSNIFMAGASFLGKLEEVDPEIRQIRYDLIIIASLAIGFFALNLVIR